LLRRDVAVTTTSLKGLISNISFLVSHAMQLSRSNQESSIKLPVHTPPPNNHNHIFKKDDLFRGVGSKYHTTSNPKFQIPAHRKTKPDHAATQNVNATVNRQPTRLQNPRKS
jgi:hypothetical protein